MQVDATRRRRGAVGAVIGDLLPLGVGVAISPIPIIAVILMLMSREASRTSVGFLIGWVAGIVVVTTVVLLLVGQAKNASQGQPSTLSSVLKLVFGVLLLLLGANEWRHKPKPGETPAMPKWMGEWLAANNATVMSVLLLVIGVVLIGKGIAALSS